MSFSERLILAGRMAMPYTLMAAFLVLALISVPAPLGLLFNAPYMVMVLFYWSLYRPTLLPHWFVFAIGLVVDLVAGFPVGVHALLFLLCRIFVAAQRRFLLGQNFVMIWMVYGLLSVVFAFLQWLLMGLLSFAILPVSGLIVSTFIGVLIFPFVCLMLHGTHQILPAPQSDVVRTFKAQRSDNAKL